MGIVLPVRMTEVTSFEVPTVNNMYYKMNDSFNKNEYDNSLNYARSMIESTCKYIFKTLNGSRIEDVFGTGRTHDYVSLNNIVENTLKILNDELSEPDKINNISSKTIDLINNIGNLRNGTPVSHGSEIIHKPITKIEAKFVMFNSENIVILLLELLFNKTHSFKKNAVGAVIEECDFKKYIVGDDYVRYVEHRGNAVISYETFSDTGVIYQVSVQLPGNDSSDTELFTDHTRDYMEDDANLILTKGPQAYVYHSNSKDFDYEVEYSGDTIYITKLGK